MRANIDQSGFLPYINGMKNLLIGSSFFFAAMSLAGGAAACDMHGGKYGFGMQSANWKSYSPTTSQTDPAFMDDGAMTPIDNSYVPPQKAKPSFSNAASTAAARAKISLAKKTLGEKANAVKEKPPVKEVALNPDR